MFLVVVITSVAVTFILPETYASSATMKVETDQPADKNQNYDPYFIQTQFEIIRSDLVLSNVIAALKLNEQWGKKYFAGETLKTSQTMEILKDRLGLAPVRNTKLMSVTVFSDDRLEAAQIANAITASYRDYRTHILAQTKAKELDQLRKLLLF